MRYTISFVVPEAVQPTGDGAVEANGLEDDVALVILLQRSTIGLLRRAEPLLRHDLSVFVRDAGLRLPFVHVQTDRVPHLRASRGSPERGLITIALEEDEH